jgi:hypothetical protein
MPEPVDVWVEFDELDVNSVWTDCVDVWDTLVAIAALELIVDIIWEAVGLFVGDVTVEAVELKIVESDDVTINVETVWNEAAAVDKEFELKAVWVELETLVDEILVCV